MSKENIQQKAQVPAPTQKTGNSFFQPKLTINAPDDVYEKEADAVAEHVIQSKTTQNRDAFFTPSASFLQRKCAHCEEEEKKAQRKEQGNETSEAPAETEQYINKLNGTGHSLPTETRSFFEERIGYDFSNVKIHTDSIAAKSAQSINALAYTTRNNIVFNEGQYQPETDSGKKLLAHELTHVVQQCATADKPVQRTPDSSTATATTSTEASESDVRTFIEEAIRFLTNSVSFYQSATVNDASIERVLVSWISMATTHLNIIETRLNNDTALIQSYKNAFNLAVRTLFTRRVSMPGSTTSVINLYLSNLYRLPRWSWPDLASFNLTNDVQRRNFVNNYITALNAGQTFQGFSTITRDQLEEVLQYLFTITTDTQNMLASSLNNDQALLNPLRNAYRNAVQTLLSTASLSISGASVLSLFMEYRYRRSMIHEWADQNIAGTTVAIPLGVSADPITGDYSFSYNGYNVTMRSDGVQSDNGAVTHADFANNPIPYSYNRATNIITSFTAPSTPSITIWTDYGPDVSARDASGYGRGRTTEDLRLGNTSLAYHERGHSRDFLSFLANTAPPAFAGTVGMTVAAFTTAVTTYNNALARIARISELATDCVGTPNIVQYHSTHGTTTTVVCP